MARDKAMLQRIKNAQLNAQYQGQINNTMDNNMMNGYHEAPMANPMGGYGNSMIPPQQQMIPALQNMNVNMNMNQGMSYMPQQNMNMNNLNNMNMSNMNNMNMGMQMNMNMNMGMNNTNPIQQPPIPQPTNYQQPLPRIIYNDEPKKPTRAPLRTNSDSPVVPRTLPQMAPQRNPYSLNDNNNRYNDYGSRGHNIQNTTNSMSHNPNITNANAVNNVGSIGNVNNNNHRLNMNDSSQQFSVINNNNTIIVNNMNLNNDQIQNQSNPDSNNIPSSSPREDIQRRMRERRKNKANLRNSPKKYNQWTVGDYVLYNSIKHKISDILCDSYPPRVLLLRVGDNLQNAFIESFDNIHKYSPLSNNININNQRRNDRNDNVETRLIAASSPRKGITKIVNNNRNDLNQLRTTTQTTSHSKLNRMYPYNSRDEQIKECKEAALELGFPRILVDKEMQLFLDVVKVCGHSLSASCFLNYLCETQYNNQN